MAGLLTTAMANPPAALARFARGDSGMGMTLGNLLGSECSRKPREAVV